MKNARGFTIVELLIVIVVIAILASLAVVAFNGIRARAVVSSVSSDLQTNLKKIKRFQIENDRWPDGDGEIANLGGTGFALRISQAENYQDHPAVTGHTRFSACYYNKDSSHGWPGAGGAEGMLLVARTSTGTVLAGTTESMTIKDITSTYEADVAAGTNTAPCWSTATPFGIYVGGINNLAPYVPAG